MERGEPTLVPGWYKGASSNSASGAPSSNHHTRSSSHSEEHSIGINKLPVSVSGYNAPRSLSFGERSSSSFRWSSSSNDYLSHEKDNSVSHSQAYSSFGRNRDRDGEKDSGLRARDRLLSLDNGFCDYSDSPMSSWSDKDNLRRSKSMISGQSFEPSPRRPRKDLSNGVHPGGSTPTGISKASFEREFPYLGAEEKKGTTGRVSSPRPCTGMDIGVSAIIGSEEWTSALVEVPIKVVGVPVISSALPSTLVSSSSTPISTGLNMAKTIAQTSHVQDIPQLTVDTQRIEELTRIQYSKLIPVTPSMHKGSSGSSDKSKSRAVKGGDVSAAQFLRAPVRPDAPKSSQSGNFQVLNRDRNGVTPTSKDGPNPTISVRAVSASPLTGAPTSVVSPPPINNLKAGANGQRGPLALKQGGFGEKKPLSLAQNRYDFFNSLRKKSGNSSGPSTAPSGSGVSSSISIGEAKDSGSRTGGECSLEENGNEGDLGCEKSVRCVADDGVNEKGSETLIDPEEAAFLRSLGWEENAGEEALTPEEIDAFVEKYVKLNPFSKLSHPGNTGH